MLLTKEEVVIQTVELLKKYGRATCDGTCQYIIGNKRCAFGLWLEDPECFKDSDYSSDLLKKHGQYILKEEVRHIVDTDFWSALQSMHDDDDDCYWDSNNNLTRTGKKFIKNTFNVDYFNTPLTLKNLYSVIIMLYQNLV